SPGYAVVSFRTFAAGPPHCALSRGPATRGYVSRRVVGLRGGPHRKKPHHRRPALPTRPRSGRQCRERAVPDAQDCGQRSALRGPSGGCQTRVMNLEDLARQIVTVFRGEVSPATRQRVQSVLGDYKPVPVSKWDFGTGVRHRAVVVERLTSPLPAEMLRDLNKLPGVTLQRNMALAPALVPHDALYPEQWALKRMRAEDAWECLKNTPQRHITVAVVDSGI